MASNKEAEMNNPRLKTDAPASKQRLFVQKFVSSCPDLKTEVCDGRISEIKKAELTQSNNPKPEPAQATTHQAGDVTIGTAAKSALISLWLDDYNDIFSDFDPRPYSQRALSDDFLNEVKKVLRETPSGKVELELLMPESLRSPGQESTIKKRLREYFKARFTHYKEQAIKIKKQGALFVSFGIVLMLVTALVLFSYAERSFWVILLSVVAEPAGWFLFWDGMELLVFDAKERKTDLDFNKRMANCNIYFKSY
jgi:hypothetical protein